MRPGLLKAIIWIYLSVGVLILLLIAFELFVQPLISPDTGASTEILDLMEKVLLCWGISLLPFLKIGQGLVKRSKGEKNVV
jgi:hypothetical protein